ncbi:hypothetical protein ACFXKC_40740 [Streptomyces sp. NPDC059340]|uniref:hypothetical protein n=1 Tax=Streptomyces sp. NPDC059340 TaxID=3346806 RepID=UPI0036BF0D2C
MTDTDRPWGVLTDEELVQRVAGIIDPAGLDALGDTEERARNMIRLVKANTTCIGDMNRGCY